MIDLELERKAFEELSYKNGARNFTKDEVDNGYCSAELDYNWHIWIKSAESKQAKIEALKAKLEQSEKVWISVDFMLPDIEQEVLLLYKSNVIQGGRFNIREDSDEYSHEWEWWCELLDTWGLDQNRVSHWMPLPKGQGDAE